MGCLTIFQNCSQKTQNKEPLYCPKEQAYDQSSIVATVIAKKGVMPALNASPIVTNGVSISHTKQTLASSLRQLELMGLAQVFPMNTINGGKDMPNEMALANKYGRQNEPDFFRLGQNFNFTWGEYFTEQNVRYINSMRGNHTDIDVYFFTYNEFTQTGSLLLLKEKQITIKGVGYTIDADYSKEVNGKFSIFTQMQTEVAPVKGYNITALEGVQKLTFAGPVYGGGAAASVNNCLGGCVTVNVAAAGGTITLPVVETTTCLCYSLFIDGDQPLPTALSALITVTDAGVVTVDGGAPAATYNITVVAANAQGHLASQCFKIVKS